MVSSEAPTHNIGMGSRVGVNYCLQCLHKLCTAAVDLNICVVLNVNVHVQMKPTDASYTLQDPSEVMAFLDRLVTWGATDANVWHAAKSCQGWKLGSNWGAAASGAPTPSRNLPGTSNGSSLGAEIARTNVVSSNPTEALSSTLRPGRPPLSAVATSTLRKSLDEQRVSLEHVTGSGAGSSGLPGGSPIASSPVKSSALHAVPQVQAASAVLAFQNLAGGSRGGSTARPSRGL